jgi:hypothetical protein
VAPMGETRRGLLLRDWREVGSSPRGVFGDDEHRSKEHDGDLDLRRWWELMTVVLRHQGAVKWGRSNLLELVVGLVGLVGGGEGTVMSEDEF